MTELLFVTEQFHARDLLITRLSERLQGKLKGRIRFATYGNFERRLEERAPDVVVLDINPCGGASSVLDRLHALQPQPYILSVYHGERTPDIAALLSCRGVDACLYGTERVLNSSAEVNAFLDAHLQEKKICEKRERQMAAA